MSKLTLVTSLFDLKRREESGRRSIDEYFRFGEFVLGLDQDVVFFCDPELVQRIFDERRKRGRFRRTHVVPMALEDLKIAKYLDPIKQSRPAANWNPSKDTPAYTLVGWSKFEMIERAAALDPFDASHLGWIDFGIAHVAKLDDRTSIEPFVDPPENVRMHMLRYFDEGDVRSCEYWDYRRGHLAGGFFLGSTKDMLELSASFWTVAETALANKYRPTEDCIVPVVVARQPGRFSFSYGDYEDILSNHVRVRSGGPHLLFQMKDARTRGAWDHSIAIGREVVASHDEGTFRCPEETFEEIILDYYIAAYHGSSHEEARKAASYYVHQVETNAVFRAAYLAHRDFVLSNFASMKPPILMPETNGMPVKKPVLEVNTINPARRGSPDSPCIILVSMIKNEAKVICRMLDSAALVATHFCLVDTGSTDDTLDVLKQWAEKSEFALAAYSIPFVDFGATRTATIEAAIQWVRNLKLDMNKTYLLLLDADMILETRGFEESQLKEDNYRVMQDQGSLAYFNVRLVRASKAFKYTGRTHEYIETTGAVVDLRTLQIKDVGDGGCKSDKFERDVRLLKQDLEENPNNSRAMYYLAASYEALGKHEDAIAMYSKRADCPNSWEEEAWMALYRRGITRDAAGDKAGAAKDFADAWARRPWRAEPLAKLSNLTLKEKQYQKACAFAKAGISIPYPKGDTLFIEKQCYNDEFHQILGIADFYTGGQYDGAEHCDHLILTHSGYHYNALQNAAWYMKPIRASRKIDLGEVFKDSIPAGYKPCNPSIVRNFDRRKGAFKYSVVLRTVNYSINPDGSYNYPGHVHTKSLLCELDSGLKRISALELESPESRPGSRIQGIEDVRIYQDRLVDDVTYAIGTRVDGPEDHPQIYACAWKEAKLVFCNRISDPKKTEKNWLPIINRNAESPQSDSGPDILYCTGPEMTLRNGQKDVYYQASVSVNTHDFRGGSSVIAYLGGWLWVVHQACILPGETKRKYLHRLCWSRGNQDGPTVDGFRTSLPFCFEKSQIEFCSGACVGPDGSLLITYGIEDNHAFMAVIDESTVANMLRI